MKKILTLFVCVFMLTACASKGEKVVKTCKLTSTDVVSGYEIQSEYIIYGTDNIANKVSTTETISSSNEEILNHFENTLTDTYNRMKESYGGYKHELIKEDGKIISKTTIDYEKMDLKKYLKDNENMNKNVDSKGRILVDKLESIYKDLGATCD